MEPIGPHVFYDAPSCFIKRKLRDVAYSGWNTNGNTIGTVVSNVVILTLFQSTEGAGVANARSSLRLLEDANYQSGTMKI